MASALARNRPALRFVLVFAAAFALLHLAWTAVRDTPVERFVIDTLTVAPATVHAAVLARWTWLDRLLACVGERPGRLVGMVAGSGRSD